MDPAQGTWIRNHGGESNAKLNGDVSPSRNPEARYAPL